MLPDIKETIFPQKRIPGNLPENFSTLCKNLDSHDVESFFMLVDAAYSNRPAVDIEKIHMDVFKKRKIAIPKLSESQQETLEILNDRTMMKELKLSIADAKRGKTTPWEKIKIPT